jgi:hypothetical protein
MRTRFRKRDQFCVDKRFARGASQFARQLTATPLGAGAFNPHDRTSILTVGMILVVIGLPLLFAVAVVWFVLRVSLFMLRVLGELVGAWARAGRA